MEVWKSGFIRRSPGMRQPAAAWGGSLLPRPSWAPRACLDTTILIKRDLWVVRRQQGWLGRAAAGLPQSGPLASL